MLHFNEAAHTYTLDGAVLPSVTQVMKPLVNFDGVPPDVLERAANYGRAVHKMVALELAGNLDYGTLDEGLYGALDSFNQWRNNYPKISGSLTAPRTLVEQIFAHTRLGYAGTPDIILEGEYVIDIKTRKPDPLKDSIQCAAYEHLFKGYSASKGKYEHRVLFLDPAGGYEFVKVNHREAWGRFRLLLENHNNLNTINSWRK